MTLGCRGICVRHKGKMKHVYDEKRGRVIPLGWYKSGNKRCNRCEIFIQWDGLWCPCCNIRLTGRPHDGVLAEQLREYKKKNRISKTR